MTEENVLTLKQSESAGQARALGLFLLKRYKEAAAAYDKLLKQDSENMIFWINRMICQLQYSPADVAFFDQMIKRVNRLPAQGYLCLSNVLQDFGRDEEALVFVNKALEMDPENVDAYILKATLLNNLGRSDELFLLMRSVYPRFKKEDRILCLEASYAALFQNVYQTNYFLEKALKLNRSAVIQNEIFYQALFSADRAEDILEFGNEALEVWKENPAVWDALARTAASLGEYETADRSFSVLSRLMDLPENLCLQWMDVSLNLKKYEQAFDLLLQVYSDSEEWLILLYEFFKRMKQDEADEECEKIAEILMSEENKTPEMQFICDMALDAERTEAVPLLMARLINDENAANEVSATSYGDLSLLEKTLNSLQVPENQSLNVLDLGCGTGTLGSVLKKYSLSEGTLTGVDVSSVALDFAFDEETYTDLQEEDLVAFCKTKDNAKKYDLIVCMDVLSYFSDLVPVFKTVKSALKQNGLFVFSIRPLAKTDQRFAFRSSGFFSHNPEFVESCLKTARLQKRELTESTLYQTEKEEMPCLIFAVQKKK